MHWLDLAIVAVIAWLTFRALSVGLIREVVTAIALVLAVILAGRYYAELAADIEFIVEDQVWRELIAFASIFLGVAIAGQIVGLLLRRVASLLLLGPVDRVGGAAFGFAKGVVVVELLLIASFAFPVSSTVDSAVDDSTLAPLFVDRIPLVLQLLPDEFEAAVDGTPIQIETVASQ